MAELTLIGMTTCPNCKMVSKVMTEKKIDHEYVLADRPDGLKIAQEHNVTSVPVLLVDDTMVIDTVIGIMEYINQS